MTRRDWEAIARELLEVRNEINARPESAKRRAQLAVINVVTRRMCSILRHRSIRFSAKKFLGFAGMD